MSCMTRDSNLSPFENQEHVVLINTVSTVLYCHLEAQKQPTHLLTADNGPLTIILSL